MENEDEYLPEGDLVPVTWTESIINTLKSVVESHAFIEEDAEELHNSNLRNTENMTVEVFQTFSFFLIVSLFSSEITSFIVVPKLFLRVSSEMLLLHSHHGLTLNFKIQLL